MKAQMGQLIEVLQTLARGQKEVRQANLRAATANPILTTPVNPLGANVPVATQPPPEGGPVHQNVAHTFDIPVQGRDQIEIDDHQDAFYNAYGP